MLTGKTNNKGDVEMIEKAMEQHIQTFVHPSEEDRTRSNKGGLRLNVGRNILEITIDHQRDMLPRGVVAEWVPVRYMVAIEYLVHGAKPFCCPFHHPSLLPCVLENIQQPHSPRIEGTHGLEVTVCEIKKSLKSHTTAQLCVGGEYFQIALCNNNCMPPITHNLQNLSPRKIH